MVLLQRFDNFLTVQSRIVLHYYSCDGSVSIQKRYVVALRSGIVDSYIVRVSGGASFDMLPFLHVDILSMQISRETGTVLI